MKTQNLKVKELNTNELKSIEGGYWNYVIMGIIFVVTQGYRDGREDRSE